ncbi:hypothetical protein ACFX13_009680 [Malus domestica]
MEQKFGSSVFFALQSCPTSPPVWPWRRTAPSLRSSANRGDGSRRKRRTQLKTPPSYQPLEPSPSDQMHDASPIDPFLRTPTAGFGVWEAARKLEEYAEDRCCEYAGRLLTDRSGTILLAMMEKLIPQTAAPEDVERFLSGCEYNSSSLQIVFRSFPESSKFATVHCTSQTVVIYALLAKKKGPCQNGQILMRVLQ